MTVTGERAQQIAFTIPYYREGVGLMLKADSKYAIEFLKGPWVDLGKNPEKVAERVYEAAGPAFLDDGVVSAAIQREMIADASVRAKPKQPVEPERVFDFSVVRKIGASLK